MSRPPVPRPRLVVLRTARMEAVATLAALRAIGGWDVIDFELETAGRADMAPERPLPNLGHRGSVVLDVFDAGTANSPDLIPDEAAWTMAHNSSVVPVVRLAYLLADRARRRQSLESLVVVVPHADERSAGVGLVGSAMVRAVLGLVGHLAIEWAPWDLRVNTVLRELPRPDACAAINQEPLARVVDFLASARSRPLSGEVLTLASSPSGGAGPFTEEAVP